MHRFALLTALLLIASVAGPAQAQQLPWEQTNGPPGGDVSELAFAPGDSTLFAVASGTLLHFNEADSLWQPAALEPRVLTLVVSSDSALFAGTGDGLFRYEGGGSWRQITLDDASVRAIAFSGEHGWFAVTGDSSLVRSTDAGQTWDKVISGLPTKEFSREGYRFDDLTASPGGGLLTSVHANGSFGTSTAIFRWDPDSLHWDNLDWVSGVAYDMMATSDEVVYVATSKGGHPHLDGGLFKVGDDTTQEIHYSSTYAVRVHGGKIWAGAFNGIAVSEDGGASWHFFESTPRAAHAFAIDKEGAVYAGSAQDCLPALDPPLSCAAGRGVFVKQSDGWQQFSAGLIKTHITGLAAGSDSLFATTEAVVWQSGSRGAQWASLQDEQEYPNEFVYRWGRGLHRAPWGDIFAIVDLYGPTAYHLRKDTTHWQPLEIGDRRTHVNVLVSHGDSTILLGQKDEAVILGPESRPRLFRSTDRGASWDTVDVAGAIYTFAKADGTIYAGADSSRVLRSTDGGQTWTVSQVNDQADRVHTLGVGPSGTLYANAGNRLYRSGDGGETWARTRSGAVNAQTIEVNSEGELFVWKGTSGDDRFLYSDDQGATLTPLSGLPHNITAIALDDDDYLYAGTGEAGVWRARSTQVGIEDPSGTGVQTVELRANYPNPFRAGTTIPFSLARPAHVELAIYDVLGRRVAVLVDGRRRAGRHTVRFAPGDLPAGVYIARLEARGRAQQRLVTRVR